MTREEGVKLKKIGIITLYGNFNYGNRLQNYALQEVLKSLNYIPESFRIMFYNDSTLFKKIIRPIKKIRVNLLKEKRTKKFEKFTKKNIDESKFIIKDNFSYHKLNNKYDYFVVGSDQVWNPNFFEGHSDVYLLNFANKNKNISYAASFGIANIEDKDKDIFAKGLNNFKSISVREKEGQKIVKDLSARDSTVVLDPTMLLSSKEWEKVMTKPKQMTNKKYILTYFLNGMNETQQKEIENLRKKQSLKIINLLNKNDMEYYNSDPSEFLYLFNHAEIIFTDSFHACVFSIIFSKPFFVFEKNKEKKSMSSRIDTLLNTFKQEFRKVNSIENMTNIFKCDYKESYKILEKEKSKSIEFLKKALKDE